jgi:propanol-preferring alcohol dehydrogenase
MRAMVFRSPGAPLQGADIAVPAIQDGQILVRVTACGVCRTDLHIIDGELSAPKKSLVLGHEIVGRVEQVGKGVEGFKPGDRVGVPWLGWTCGECTYCRSGRENLCDRALFTGYTLDGGYAEFTAADARFCLRLPEGYSDEAAAPLLCAGLIGNRCLKKTGDAQRLGLYGFGVSAHIIAQIAKAQGRQIYAFTRPGDSQGQASARAFGAVWAGGSDTLPPQELDAAVILAPVGELVPQALRASARGACVVCGGIHMSEIPAFSYDLLWQERTVSSVANLTRRDGAEFMELAGQHPIRSPFQTFPLEEANTALAKLRDGSLQGAAVLVP